MAWYSRAEMPLRFVMLSPSLAVMLSAAKHLDALLRVTTREKLVPSCT